MKVPPFLTGLFRDYAAPLLKPLTARFADESRPAVKRQPRIKYREARRGYLRVTDPEKQRRIALWFTRRREAEEAIAEHLKMVSPVVFGAETPFYKTDEDGVITEINFQYAIGLTHEGWSGRPGTNWLHPVSDKALQAVRALPRLPQIREINEMIGWPHAYVGKDFEAMHIPGYEDFAREANEKTRISVTPRGEIVISLPFAESFADFPPLAKEVNDWEPPPWLERIPDRVGRRAERGCEFNKSALGQFLQKCHLRSGPDTETPLQKPARPPVQPQENRP